MPELPEVETVRRGLEEYLIGHTLREIQLNREGLRFPFPTDLRDVLKGKTVLTIDRRGKYLLIRLSENKTLLSHLGMSGSFTFVKESEYRSKKHDHLLFYLSNNSILVYNDPRRFGVIDVFQTGGDNSHRLLHHLGPEPILDSWNTTVFANSIRNRKGAIKTTLLNQQVVVGVGNIYACEALFLSGISPRRGAGSIAGKMQPGIRAKRLVKSIKTVLTKAIEAGGSTLKDFQNVDGKAGYFAHQFNVYGREGESCLRELCSGEIKRFVQGGRSTFYCPKCQR